MTKVNIHQAKTQFFRLVELAASGEEIIIAKSGQPVARLVPYRAKGVVRKPLSRNCDSYLTTECSSVTASPQKDCRRSSFDFATNRARAFFQQWISSAGSGGFNNRLEDGLKSLPVTG
jgi:prevent-host-death family protein